LNEVLHVADRVTVLRHGKLVATLARSECDPEKLARLMVGKSTSRARRGSDRGSTHGAEAARLTAITVRDHRGLESLRRVSLTVHGGELLGVAGVAGNGQLELAEVITGLRAVEEGTVTVGGKDLTGSRAQAFINAGVSYIPEDRRGTGLVPSEPIWRNAILKSYRDGAISRAALLRTRSAKRYARNLATQVALSTSNVDTPVEYLSGGNAQRLLAGREIAAGKKLLVAVNPTQGLDFGAAGDVGQALLRAREMDIGVLLISYDLDEILRLCDRILVMYAGAIVGDFAGAGADRDRIGLLMGGLDEKAAAAHGSR
jgi:simple sugar transport system ATP-binding protein